MGAPFILLQEKIMEESKKRERRDSNRLLNEINQLESCSCLAAFSFTSMITIT